MIPYEDLCAALDGYAARNRGEATPAGDTMHGGASPDELPPPDSRLAHEELNDPADQTHVGVSPLYEDRSNELDLGDVLADEDV